MRTIHLITLSLCLLCLSCKTKQKLVTDSSGNPVPQVTWEQDKLELGIIKKGETRDMVFNFTNTGSADLLIDLVTSCKCTSLDWPRLPIPPGGKGQIHVTFDSTDQKLGMVDKVIDIIANTDPRVVEGFFTAKVVP